MNRAIRSVVAVAFLLLYVSAAPAQMSLVLATRTDPPFVLHRLRARGQMTELRAAALRFNRAETELFLKESLSARHLTGLILALAAVWLLSE